MPVDLHTCVPQGSTAITGRMMAAASYLVSYYAAILLCGILNE